MAETCRSATPALLRSALLLLAVLAGRQQHLRQLPDKALVYLARVRRSCPAAAQLPGSCGSPLLPLQLAAGDMPQELGRSSASGPRLSLLSHPPFPHTSQCPGVVEELGAMGERGLRVQRFQGLLAGAALRALPADPAQHEPLLLGLLTKTSLGACAACPPPSVPVCVLFGWVGWRPAGPHVEHGWEQHSQ